MTQQQPTFGRVLDPALLSRVLSIDPLDMADRFPIQEVSTGLPSLIVPLKNLKAVKGSRIQRDLYFDLVKRYEIETLLVFSPETYSPDNQLNVRVFAENSGVPEDPATGSANGCLAGYLAKHMYFGHRAVDFRVEQ